MTTQTGTQRPSRVAGKRLAFAYGSLCYLIFLGTVLYGFGFIGNLVVPKSIDSGVPIPAVQAVLLDALLLGLFAFQHSVMARPAFKAWWTRIIPPPIERSTYVLLASLLLLLLFWQWQPLPGVVWNVDQPVGHALLLGLYVVGWILVIYCTCLISHFSLFGLKQVYDNLRGIQPGPQTFQTPGLYKLVRHPLMVAFFIAFWVTPRMTFGHLLFALGAAGYICVGVLLEERDLVCEFSDSYRTYQRQVFMLLPWPRRKS
jgi:protein-S-isoprenylcysteine O-methyltransferase Ste14